MDRRYVGKLEGVCGVGNCTLVWIDFIGKYHMSVEQSLILAVPDIS
jgi:hypothetical protein